MATVEIKDTASAAANAQMRTINNANDSGDYNSTQALTSGSPGTTSQASIEDGNASADQLSSELSPASVAGNLGSFGPDKKEGSSSGLLFDDYIKGTYHSAGLYERHEIDYCNKRYRFGILDPYRQITNCREYLFFTKPDLNIKAMDNITGRVMNNSNSTGALHKQLQQDPFWKEMILKYPDVVKMLQYSCDMSDPFNHLLENCVSGNLEIPGMSTDMIESATNYYGVNLQYHGSAEASSDNFDFSLEFKDTKDLALYHFFRAYEEYEILKHHGRIGPPYIFIADRILYDHYSIYKFLVDEDGETILYYAKFYGVTSKSLPRDVFSNTNFDGGISYNIDFHCSFFDDMNPAILSDFNSLSATMYNRSKYQIDIWNDVLDRVDARPAKAAMVFTQRSNNWGRNIYKLKWRGDDKL